MGFLKWVIFLVGSNYINTEDNNYDKTVLFQRAWFSWFHDASLVSRFVFCANTVAHLCLRYVLRFELRHQLAVQEDWSSRLHISPYLFFLLSNCTYNSHIIKKRKYFCATFAYKFSPTEIIKAFFGVTSKKFFMSFSANLGRHFLKPSNVGRHFYADLQGCCPDFQQIKTFGVCLHHLENCFS